MSTERALRLAANGYADLYALLDSGENLALDCIKCPLSEHAAEEVKRAMRYRPVLLHGWGPAGYSATQSDIPEPERLCELAGHTATPWLSVHLDPDPRRDGEKTMAQILRQVAASVQTLRHLSGVPILLENVPHYSGRPKPRFASDPAFIADALEISGAGFLLDLAHARVAAYHRQEDVYDYLNRLPLRLVQEIHISGPRMEADGLKDRHLALQDADWDLLHWTLEKTPNLVQLTHEYMGLRPNTAAYAEAHGPDILKGELQKMNAVRTEMASQQVLK